MAYTAIPSSGGGGGGGGGGAPDDATYVTLSTNGTLTSERVLTAGSGITITDGGAGAAATIAATGGAPTAATYVTLSTNGTLTNERVLTAGTNITFTDAGAGGTLTIDAAGGGAGGYGTIENPNGTPVTARAIASFSSAFTATDNVDTTDIDLAAAGVAFAKIANGSARSLFGRSANSAGVMASITGASGQFLKDDGTSLAFAALTQADITGGTSTRVPFYNASGVLTSSASHTWDETTTGRFQLALTSVADAFAASHAAPVLKVIKSSSAGSVDDLVHAAFVNPTVGVGQDVRVFFQPSNLTVGAEIAALAPGSSSAYFRFFVSQAGVKRQSLELDQNMNVTVGAAALATTATDGFLYITTCAGAPTGVPTTKTGRVALQYDSTNKKLYAYNGAWEGVTFA